MSEPPAGGVPEVPEPSRPHPDGEEPHGQPRESGTPTPLSEWLVGEPEGAGIGPEGSFRSEVQSSGTQPGEKGGGTPASPDPAALLRQATFLLDIERPRDALSVLQRLVDWLPEDAGAWCAVARAFFAVGDLERAQQAAERAIAADAFSADGHAWKCRVLLQDHEAKAALAAAQIASEMTYRDPEVERWMVRALLAGDRRAEANEYLARAQLPDDAETASLRGELARLIHERAAADAWFRRGIELSPACSAAWSGLAGLLLAQKRIDEALHCIHVALQHSPARAELGGRTVEIVDALLGRKAPGLARFGLWALVVAFVCSPCVAPWLVLPLALAWYFGFRGYDRRRRATVLASLPADLQQFYPEQKAVRLRGTWQGAAGCVIVLLLVVAGGALLAGALGGLSWDAVVRVVVLSLVAVVWVSHSAFTRQPKAIAAIRFRFPGEPGDAEADEDEAADEGAEPPPSWDEDLVSAGMRLLNEGKAAAAREKARAALAADPEAVAGLLLFSASSLVLQEFDAGLAAAKSARTHDPDDFEARALVWANLAAGGQLEAAVANAEEDRDVAEAVDEYLLWLIHLQFLSGSHPGARAISALVQRVYPGSAAPHRVEAQWACRARRWPEAEAAFRRALTLEPESASLHCELGWVLEARWRFREARSASRRALAIDAEMHDARALLERHSAVGLLVFGGLLSLAISAAATMPTLLGSTTNRWIVPATFLTPIFTSGIVFLLVKPVVRMLAPRLVMEVRAAGSIDARAYALVTGLISLTVCLTVHTAQAWLEIALHRQLLPERWPAAATITACAAVMWFVMGKIIRWLRQAE